MADYWFSYYCNYSNSSFFFVSKKSSLDISKDYGNNVDGFVKAAQDCQLSRINYTISSFFNGHNITSIYSIEILGMNESKCVYTSKIVETYSDWPEYNNVKDNFVGLNKTCAYNPKGLTSEDLKLMFEGKKEKDLNEAPGFSLSAEQEGYIAECIVAVKELSTNNQNQKSTNQQNTSAPNKTLETNNPPSQTCVENWECGNWLECSGGVKSRTCQDINNCGTTTNKPTTDEYCHPATCAGFGDTICQSGTTCSVATYQAEDTNECCPGSCVSSSGGISYGGSCAIGGPACVGGLQCSATGGNYGERKCLECGLDKNCNSGFSCSGGRCISSSTLNDCTWSNTCSNNLFCWSNYNKCVTKGDLSITIDFGTCPNCKSSLNICKFTTDFNANGQGSFGFDCIQCLSNDDCKEGYSCDGTVCRAI